MKSYACLLLVIGAHCNLPVVTVGQDAQAHDNPFLDAGSVDVGWPFVRGPNFDGVSVELRLADSWPDTGPPVLWTKELGQGYSSWVVKDNRAYTQYQTLAGQFVICVDASDGRTIWRYRYDLPFEVSGLYPGPRSSPTIANGHIYFSTPAGAVACLNEDGRLIWRRDLKSEFDGKGTDFGYSCSPTVVDGKVIMPVGGQGASVVALDAADGSILWASGDASASYTPALPITVDNHRQVIGYLEHELAAFDRETGRQLWRQKLSRGYSEHSAWPIFHEPFLWIAEPFQGGSQLLKLSGGETASFRQVWQSSIMSNDVSSSVLVNGHVYGFDLAEAQSKAQRPSRGSFRCMNLLTGEITWSNGDADVRRSTDFEENKSSGTIGHACVIVADEKLILFNDLGDLILAKVDSQEYVELARTPALKGEICWAAPALDRGRVFLRNHTRAVCLYIGKADLMGSVAKGKTLSLADVPQVGAFDVAAVLGVEPEYAMIPPTWRWLRIWYLASLAILVIAGVLAGLVKLMNASLSAPAARWWFWSVAMLLGAIGGTLTSLASDEFVFTWPVTLFLAFQISVYQSTQRRSKEPRTRQSKWKDRAVAAAFLVICFVYFFLCRRLSLVTEWVFLCGFAAAFPVLVVSRSLAIREKKFWLVAEFLLTLVAFSAFFALSVFLLSSKYDLHAF